MNMFKMFVRSRKIVLFMSVSESAGVFVSTATTVLVVGRLWKKNVKMADFFGTRLAY